MLTGVPSTFDEIIILVQAYEAAPDNRKPSTKWVIDQINKTAEKFTGVAGDFIYDKELGFFRLEPGVNVIKNGLVEPYVSE
jgi:hypothetical protein